MDAPLRRRLLAASLVTALSGAGCGMLSHEADRQVEESFSDPSLPRRGQAPDGPKAPATLPPARTTLPVPSRPDAPVVPLDTGKPVITPVGGAEVRPAAAAEADSAVRPVATVGADNIITDEEVSMMMKQRARDYVMLKGEERERKEKEVYTEELKKLIDRELILTEFLGRVKKNNPGAMDELWEQAGKMADSHMREMRKAFKIKTEAEFTAELEKQGLPYKLFRRQVERNALMNMFLNTVLKDKNDAPTLAQVQDYYARHADEFKTGDRIKFQHLFVAVSQFDSPAAAKRRAEELWDTARRGADFVQLVKEHGHGDSKLREGAGVGEKRGEIQPPELEKVVWDIKPGNFSAVVPSENGFHVVKVLERDVAGTRPLDEKLQIEIKNKLTDQAIKVERDKLTAQLWRQIGVTIEGGR
jgi:parvulin-like peptidyl-prolyl isomerase